MDYHTSAIQLLEMLANSIYDRNPNMMNATIFTTTEITLVEKWICYLVEKGQGMEALALSPMDPQSE